MTLKETEKHLLKMATILDLMKDRIKFIQTSIDTINERLVDIEDRLDRGEMVINPDFDSDWDS